MIRLLVILTSVVLLQSCATTPKPTLKLSDVPVLYEAPALSKQSVKTAQSVIEQAAPLLASEVNLDEVNADEVNVDEVKSALGVDGANVSSDVVESTIAGAPVVADEIKSNLDVDGENVSPEAVEKSIAGSQVLGDEVNSELIVDSENTSPEVVENTTASLHADSCAEMANEIDEISAGLGSAAIETPPNTASPTVAQRAGKYIYNLGAQTVLGALQPVIQTKRMIFNDDEKERRLAQSVERGQTRRAYLIGYAQASGCDQQVAGPVQGSEEADTANN